MDGKRKYRIFLTAGEPSGDALGVKLMQGLKIKLPDQVEFFGVGGPLMCAEGMCSLFPMEELTVMGLFEVLPRLRLILSRISETAKNVSETKSDIFISIDAPDFSFRVAKKLNGSVIPKVHYVAPSVWVWRPGRAKKIAALYDHLLTVLPFEPLYFTAVGLPSTFVGHSVVETGADNGDAAAFKAAYQIPQDEKILLLLAGSRRGEVARHLPIFEEALKRVKADVGNFTVVAPVIGPTGKIVSDALRSWPFKSIIIDGAAEKYDAMAAADVALAASGTVGLELALAGLPNVIGYKMNPLTSWFARRMIKIRHVNLVNILLKRDVVPEHILEFCTVENLHRSLTELFRSEQKRKAQIDQFQEAMLLLGQGGQAPGVRAANVIVKLLTEKD
ncbi:MAG: lipid-A-disaccharide synthase [Sneathiella sp.]|uniref:lipid-A-disaccharide synthase n=1 Tax=Sneathiella sp. TaxID=1964365 RepID=UPI0030017166